MINRRFLTVFFSMLMLACLSTAATITRYALSHPPPTTAHYIRTDYIPQPHTTPDLSTPHRASAHPTGSRPKSGTGSRPPSRARTTMLERLAALVPYQRGDRGGACTEGSGGSRTDGRKPSPGVGRKDRELGGGAYQGQCDVCRRYAA